VSEQYPDLGITQKQDGDYWDVVIPNLDCNTDYALQAAWVYADKAFGTSEFSDRFNFTTPAPSRVCPINVVATWDATAGLNLTWTKNDDRVRNYVVSLTAGGYTRSQMIPATGTSLNYSWVLTRENNIFQFGNKFRTSFTAFTIQSIYGDGSSDQCPVTLAPYVDPICANSIPDNKWNVSSTIDGIMVSWQDDLSKSLTYKETRVFVSLTNNPYNWVQRYTGIGPADIGLDTINDVYVKVNHLSYSDCQGLDSSVKTGKLFDPLTFDREPPNEVTLGAITWSGEDLVIPYTMPATNAPDRFKITLTNSLTPPTSAIFYKEPSSPSGAQSLKISYSELLLSFGYSNLTPAYTGLFQSRDIAGNFTAGVAFTTPTISCQGTGVTPTITDAFGISAGYTVMWTAPSWATSTDVYARDEGSQSSSSALVYSGTSPAIKGTELDANPFAKKIIKIRHVGKFGCYSNFSLEKTVSPVDSISFDDTPPDPVTNASAAWNVRDLDVSFTIPAINLPSYVKVHLTSGTKTRSFEYPVSVAASTSTSVKITRSKLIESFGESPSSFSSGYITDLDIYRNENTTQVSISGLATAVKPNPLSGIPTTISVTALSNGYSVSSNLNANATGIKVYQSSTENGTYSLVASSNSSPVIVYDESNAGSTVWVKGQWTSEEGLATISAAVSVTIIDVASLSLIENPVKIKTDGSIFAGTLDANDNPVLSGARMLINKRGLFLYDSNDLNGTNPTTQIIGEDNGVTATFITQKAKIADWIISTGKIENTGNAIANVGAVAGTFTGLSPNGVYSFWAGGGVAGGYSVNANEDAKFSVTKAGYVRAKNLHITGGTIKVGDNFEVDVNGLIKAIDAELSGTIKASSGILGSMDIGGTIKVNGEDTVVDGQLRVTATSGNIEIGKLSNSQGIGIQGTSTSGKLFQLDTTDGIITNKGRIGGWEISLNKIEKGNTFSEGTPAVSVIRYAGMSPGNTYSFWAGSLSPGGSDTAEFYVKPNGYVKANNIDITGGKLKVGSGFEVAATTGLLKANDANIRGSIYVDNGVIGSVQIGGSAIRTGDTSATNFGNGQILLTTDTGKIEFGLLKDKDGLSIGTGLQVTSTENGQFVSLDTVNGIKAVKGLIAGWTLAKHFDGNLQVGSSINYGNNVGLYAPATSSDSAVMIWAGGTRTVSPNFSVTYAGKMTAVNAVIKGDLFAGQGGFGTASVTTAEDITAGNTTGYKITSGWTINSANIKSTSTSSTASQITLNGEQGSIIGGNIVGSNHYFTTPANWNTLNPGSGSGNTGTMDYISSSGNFKLANGNLTYNGTEFKVTTDLVASNIFLGTGVNFSNDYLLGKDTTVPATGPGGVTKTAGSFSLGGGAITYNANTRYFEINGTGASYANFKIRLNVTSNEDNTFGDSTVVQDSSGNLTTGRAFYYGGATLPTAGSGATARSTAQDPTGRPFVKGDIWLSRTA
jgi:hypothetical protein